MEAMESPPPKDPAMQDGRKRDIDSEFKLDSNDNSFGALDFAPADDEGDAKMYDLII